MDVRNEMCPPRLPRAVVCSLSGQHGVPSDQVRDSWIRYKALRGARPYLRSDYDGFPFSWLTVREEPFWDICIGGESLKSAAALYAENLWSHGCELAHGARGGADRECPFDGNLDGGDGAHQFDDAAISFYRRFHKGNGASLPPSPALLKQEGLGNDAALSAFLAARRGGLDEEDAADGTRDAAAVERISDFIHLRRALQRRGGAEHIALWPDASLGVSDVLRCAISVPADRVVGDAPQAPGDEPLVAYLRAYDAFASAHRPYLALLRAVAGLIEKKCVAGYDPCDDQDGVFYQSYADYRALWEHVWAAYDQAPDDGTGAEDGEAERDSGLSAAGSGTAARTVYRAPSHAVLTSFVLSRLTDLIGLIERYEAEHPGVANRYFGEFDDPESCLDSIECDFLFNEGISLSPYRGRVPQPCDESHQEEEPAGKAECEPDDGECDLADSIWERGRVINLLNETYESEWFVDRITEQELSLESIFQQVDVEDARGVWRRTSLGSARARLLEAWWRFGSWALEHPDAVAEPVFRIGAYRKRWERAVSFVGRFRNA